MAVYPHKKKTIQEITTSVGNQHIHPCAPRARTKIQDVVPYWVYRVYTRGIYIHITSSIKGRYGKTTATATCWVYTKINITSQHTDKAQENKTYTAVFFKQNYDRFAFVFSTDRGSLLGLHPMRFQNKNQNKEELSHSCTLNNKGPSRNA